MSLFLNMDAISCDPELLKRAFRETQLSGSKEMHKGEDIHESTVTITAWKKTPYGQVFTLEPTKEALERAQKTGSSPWPSTYSTNGADIQGNPLWITLLTGENTKVAEFLGIHVYRDAKGKAYKMEIPSAEYVENAFAQYNQYVENQNKAGRKPPLRKLSVNFKKQISKALLPYTRNFAPINEANGSPQEGVTPTLPFAKPKGTGLLGSIWRALRGQKALNHKNSNPAVHDLLHLPIIVAAEDTISYQQKMAQYLNGISPWIRSLPPNERRALLSQMIDRHELILDVLEMPERMIFRDIAQTTNPDGIPSKGDIAANAVRFFQSRGPENTVLKRALHSYFGKRIHNAHLVNGSSPLSKVLFEKRDEIRSLKEDLKTQIEKENPNIEKEELADKINEGVEKFLNELSEDPKLWDAFYERILKGLEIEFTRYSQGNIDNNTGQFSLSMAEYFKRVEEWKEAGSHGATPSAQEHLGHAIKLLMGADEFGQMQSPQHRIGYIAQSYAGLPHLGSDSGYIPFPNTTTIEILDLEYLPQSASDGAMPLWIQKYNEALWSQDPNFDPTKTFTEQRASDLIEGEDPVQCLTEKYCAESQERTEEFKQTVEEIIRDRDP